MSEDLWTHVCTTCLLYSPMMMGDLQMFSVFRWHKRCLPFKTQ